MYSMNDKQVAYQAAVPNSYPQGSTGPAETRQPEVIAEMERLVRAVDQLGSIAEMLTGRLNPVRRQTGNGINSSKEASAPEPILCGYATGIRNQRQAVEHHMRMLQTALDELEI